MMKKLLVAMALLVSALNVQGQVTRGIPVIDVTAFDAIPNDGIDDTDEIAAAMDAAVAYQAANNTSVRLVFPKGTFEVQDATTEITGTTESYGGIVIPSTAESIILSGNDTTIKAGDNGVSSSIIRCFADNCIIEGFVIDPNADNAPVYSTGGYTNGTLTANGTTTIAGSGTTWTKEMVGRTILISGNATVYTITGFTSTTSLTLDGSPTGGAGLTYTIYPFATKDNSGIELNGCENSVIRDCYVLNGDKTISTYSTGTVSYDHTGGSSERLVTLSGGSWPGWVDTDAAITIAGERYAIASVPTTTTLTLGADSSTRNDNNPGGDVGSTADWAATAYSTTSGGENHFLIVNGRRCRIERCLSLDCAFSPFFVSSPTDDGIGNDIYEGANYITDCTAVNFKGNGIRVNDGRSLFVRGFVCYTTRNDGRSGILCDAGSSVGNLRTDRIFIEDCELYCNPDGDFDGASSTLKLAAANQIHVSNCKIEAGASTNNVAVRLEDNLRSVFLENSYIKPVILFTPADATASIFQGDLTAAADNGSGKVRYTVVGTPSSIVTDRELHVRGSSVLRYNGPQQVIGRGSAGGGYIDTDRNYVSSAIGTGAHGQTGVESFKMHNCTIDGIVPAVVSTVSFYNYFIDSCNAYNVDIEGCTFNQFAPLDVQYGCIQTDYATENGWSMFRFVRNKVYFDSDKTCRVHRGQNTAGTEISTSGKTIFYGNEKHNKDVGTTYWTDETNGERAILFTTDGENPRAFRHSAYPVAAHVTWAVGDIIYNTAPSGTEPFAWVCTTAGSPGTWQPIGLDYTLQSTIVDVGNVGTGEDNLITYTLPANTLNSEGEGLEIEAGFSFANNTNTKQVKMYFGAASFFASGPAAHQDGGMVVRAVVTRDTSSIAKVGYLMTSSGGNVPFAVAAGDASNASADMTAAITIKGTGEATSDNDVVMEYLRVRKIPAP